MSNYPRVVAQSEAFFQRRGALAVFFARFVPPIASTAIFAEHLPDLMMVDHLAHYIVHAPLPTNQVTGPDCAIRGGR